MTAHGQREPGRRRGAAAALCTCLALLLLAPPSGAQVPGHPSTGEAQVPPPPAGTSAIRGAVTDREAPGATGGLDVALYALRSDGSPGIGRAVTDADGRFSFENISGAPDIVYLVGVRYAGVPYGERIAFQPGQKELELELEVAPPLLTGENVKISSSTMEIEWRGTQLAIAEEHRITNRGRAVVYVPPEQRAGARAPFEIGLPEGHEGFQTPLGNATDGYEDGPGKLSFWGPVYVGEQTLRFGYRVPIGTGDAPVSITSRFPLGTRSFSVRVAEGGPRVSASGLAARTVEIDGQTFQILETGSLAAGTDVVLDVAVPETRRDVNALRLGRAEVTAELDDTVLTVTQHARIIVEPGAYLAGSPGDPLLRFELPPGANLEGLTSDAHQLGITATPDGIDVLGPLGPGEHDFAVRYRVPATGGVASIDLRFPLLVPTLSMQIADTGLIVDSPRLHRLRPQQRGTRTWLLREAFHIVPSESVPVRFEALDHAGASANTSLAVMLGLGALLMLFIVGPLRRQDTSTIDRDDTWAGGRELDLVYTTIHDLDHDYETGKVGEEDYRQTRVELRSRAIELLRDERRRPAAGSDGKAEVKPEVQAEVRTEEERIPSPAAAEIQTGAFCPGCGEKVAAEWTFCSHCGGRLSPAESAGTQSEGEPAA